MATGPRSLYKGSEELTLECDICKHQGLTAQAVSYCGLCTEALCPACHKVHRAGKLTRDHKLMTGDQLLAIPTGSQRVPAFMMCVKHQLPMTYFCKDDDVVFCSTCKVTSHRSCDTTDLVTHAAKTKPSKMFGEIKSHLTQLEQQHETFMKRTTADKGLLNTQLQACLDEVKRARQKINGILDDIEKKMKDEIKDAEMKIVKELDDHLVIANDTLKQIRHTMKLVTESENTQKDDVMFVGIKQAEAALPNYKKSIVDLEEGTPIQIKLEPNEKLQTHLEHILPFGELTQLPSLSTLTLDEGSFYSLNCDNDCDNIQSIIFLPGGHVVLACVGDGLKLLDSTFQVISELPMRAIKACKVSGTEILVTNGVHEKATFVDVLPTMVPREEFSVGRICAGVDYYQHEAFIGCHDFPGNGEVRVVNRNGQVQRRLGFDGKNYMFTLPVDVKVTSNGDKVIVADLDEHCVICLDQQGQVVYRYDDTDMIGPCDILLDAYDNLLVCGVTTHNVHAVSRDGEKRKVLLSENDGLRSPMCISYRYSDGCFAVGFHATNDNRICTFHAKNDKPLT